MTKAHALLLAASFVASFGTNRLMAPKFDYEAWSDGPTLASGELVASGGSRTTIKLVDIRVVAADVPKTFGDTLAVRQLLLRGALGEGQTETDLEIWVDLSGGRPIAPNDRSSEAFKGRPLAVLPRAVASGPVSRVRLPGSEETAYVKQGTLTLSEALELEPGIWRVRGDLDVELEQGDHVSSLFGRLAGRLVWP